MPGFMQWITMDHLGGDASAEWEGLRREREKRQQGFAFDVPGELKL